MNMLQLEPMIPVFVPKFNMEGYAFIATQLSQEHHILFTIALDNGEIWELNNKEVRFCKNITMEREKLLSSPTEFGAKQHFNKNAPA
jgi:hypothetical protein